MMQKNPELTIIIVSYNTKTILKDCLDSLTKNINGLDYELMIVDNNSQDGTREYLNAFQKNTKNSKVFLMNENLGFGKANNYAMKRSTGKYLLLLNSDTIIKNDVITKVVRWMDNNPKYGLASPNLYNPDGSVQGTGGYFPTLASVFSWMTIQDLPFVDRFIKPFHPMKSYSLFPGVSFYDKEKDLDWLTGAFFMIRREAYKDTGYFDEDFFMYAEEVEYCIRLKSKGWLVRYLPYDGLIHIGGASGKVGQSIIREFEGIKLIYRKHYSWWKLYILRLLIKIGCLWRIPIMWMLRGKEGAIVYAKAFIKT